MKARNGKHNKYVCTFFIGKDDDMVRIDAHKLKVKYNKDFHGGEKYATIVKEVLEKKHNVILDFTGEKECSQGYNSLWQHLNRHGLKNDIRIAMRNDDSCGVYRLVISFQVRRRDLLFQNDDACERC